MNAAAKIIHQNNIFSGRFADIRVSKMLCLQVVLIVAVLLTALSVIYTTNGYRITYSQLQYAKEGAHELKLHWGQLLLEQASLETPARVEYMAKRKLSMVQPKHHKVHMLRIE